MTKRESSFYKLSLLIAAAGCALLSSTTTKAQSISTEPPTPPPPPPPPQPRPITPEECLLRLKTQAFSGNSLSELTKSLTLCENFLSPDMLSALLHQRSVGPYSIRVPQRSLDDDLSDKRRDFPNPNSAAEDESPYGHGGRFRRSLLSAYLSGGGPYVLPSLMIPANHGARAYPGDPDIDGYGDEGLLPESALVSQASPGGRGLPDLRLLQNDDDAIVGSAYPANPEDAQVVGGSPAMSKRYSGRVAAWRRRLGGVSKRRRTMSINNALVTLTDMLVQRGIDRLSRNRQSMRHHMMMQG